MSFFSKRSKNNAAAAAAASVSQPTPSQSSSAGSQRQTQQMQQQQQQVQQLQQKPSYSDQLASNSQPSLSNQALMGKSASLPGSRSSSTPVLSNGGPHLQQFPPSLGTDGARAQFAQLGNGNGNGSYPSQHQQQQTTMMDDARMRTPSGNSSPVVYPWTQRRLTLPQTPPSLPPHLTPFPRYGLSTPPTTTSSGYLFLFGGLVADSVRNDLFVLDCKTLTIAPVPPKGDVPIARVGHATGLVGNVMISWGGDTKTRAEDQQDQGLYLLNMANNEWSCILTDGRRGGERREMPVGRYGHAVCMVRNKFFMFGGQVDLTFFDDLWCFDLTTIKTSDGPAWERIIPRSNTPQARTGHICVTFNNQIILFGGTDGEFHYNDTWSYNVQTQEWTELDCIGYLPVAREGHAAAVVGDVVYVFGGRDVQGKDLGDLAAFKISTRRWFMFQNMGPSPNPRSGHALTAYGDKILVLGGESASNPPDSPDIIHVLDTSKIKYPPDPSRPVGQNVVHRKSSAPHLPSQQQTPHANPFGPRSSSVAGQSSPREFSQFSQYKNEPMALVQATKTNSFPDDGSVGQSEPFKRALSPDDRQLSGLTSPTLSQKKQAGTIPQRPRREDDAAFGIGDPQRAASPRRMQDPVNGQSQQQPDSIQDPSMLTRVMTPVNPVSPRDESMSREATDSPTLPSSQHPPSASAASGRLTSMSQALSARSPSPSTPVLPSSDAVHSPNLSINSSVHPPDAFYNPRSPLLNGSSPLIHGGGHARQSSLTGKAGQDLMREIKAKDAELERSRRRERWLKLELGRAVKGGFVVEDLGEGSQVGLEEMGEEGSELRRLVEGLLMMKKARAQLQAELATQIQQSSARFSEADRIRQAAIEEAAFYRAKVEALEHHSPADVARVERDRSIELEKQLSSTSSNYSAAQRQLTSLQETHANEKQLRSAAEEREQQALRRIDDLTSVHSQTSDELMTLQDKHTSTERSLRDHMDRLVSLETQVVRHETERDLAKSSLEERATSRGSHMQALEQLQQALSVSGIRSDEVQSMYQSERDRNDVLESELADMKSELEVKAREAEMAIARLTEVEASWSKSREETESLRTFTSSGLAELIQLHRGLKEDEGQSSRGHDDKITALEQQASSLRTMLGEAGTRVDESQSMLSDHRKKTRQLEIEHASTQTTLHQAQSALAASQAESAKLRDSVATKELELKDQSAAVSELELRLSILRRVLSNHGVALSEDELHPSTEDGPDSTSSTSSASTKSLKELMAKLSEKTSALEATERELDLARRKLERAVSPTSSKKGPHPETTQPEAEGINGGESAEGAGSAERVRQLEERAEAAEKQVVESAASHKQIQADYQTAVHYVKATEKMLRRMKEDVTKHKTANLSLQTELDAIRGTNSSEAGSRTRDANGRNTPVVDDATADSLRLKLADAQRQLTTLSRVSLDNQTLSKDNKSLKLEHEKLKEAYTMELDQANERINSLSTEIDRLQQLSVGVQDVKRLQLDVRDLKLENEQLQEKVRLLLDAQDDQPVGARRSPSGLSHYDTEDDMDEEDLHRYIRAHSPPSSLAYRSGIDNQLSPA